MVCLLGKIFYSSKDYEKSLFFFLLNYKKDTNNVNCLLYLAKSFEKLNEHPKAIITVKKACMLDPENGNLFYYLGKLLYKNNIYDSALEKLSKAIKLNPLDGKSLIYLSLCKVKNLNTKCDIDEIKHIVDKGLNLLSNDIKFQRLGRFLIAEEMEKENRFNEAIVAYERIFKYLGNDQLAVLNKIGQLYLKTKDFSNALSTYLKVFQLDQKNNEVVLQIAVLFSFMGKFNDSLKFFKYSIEIDPMNSHSLVMISRIYRDKYKMLELALEHLQKALSFHRSPLIMYEVYLLDCFNFL